MKNTKFNFTTMSYQHKYLTTISKNISQTGLGAWNPIRNHQMISKKSCMPSNHLRLQTRKETASFKVLKAMSF